MIDKEKVLHGLNSCGFHDGIPNICEVTECPYCDNKAYCVHELAHDAGMMISELLKAQEPRVLSFAEAMLDTDRDVIWVEFKDDPIVEAAIPGFAVNEYADVFCAGFDSEDGTIRLSSDQCGTIWRPWSLRPTDAQREATPWN